MTTEIGRELNVAELAGREKTVLALRKEGATAFVTMWLTEITPALVFFFAGVGNTTLGLIPQSDGTLRDGLGRQIHVYEYLGGV